MSFRRTLLPLLCLAACSRPAQPPATSPRPDRITAPIEYFQEHCARCHGAYGSAYDPTILRELDDSALVRIVEGMARGPAQVPLEGRALDGQVALHRSMMDDHPFVALIARDGRTLAGEVTPGARVTVRVAGHTIAAEVTGHRWAATLPAGTAPDQAISIDAEHSGRRSQIDTSSAAHSHGQAAPR